MDALWDEAIKLAFAVATVTLVPLVSAYLVKLLKRAGLAVEAEQQAKLEKFAQQAILAAEEWARARVKQSAIKVLSDEKLEAAVGVLMAKLPHVTQAEAVAVIQAELPKLRAATGGLLSATTNAVIN